MEVDDRVSVLRRRYIALYRVSDSPVRDPPRAEDGGEERFRSDVADLLYLPMSRNACLGS